MLEEHLSYMNLNQGFKLLERKKFDEAIDYFRERLDKNSEAYYGLGTAKFRRLQTRLRKRETDVIEIIALYEKAIELDPNNADFYLMLGMALEKSVALAIRQDFKKDELNSKLKDAVKAFNEAIKLNPHLESAARNGIVNLQRLESLLSQGSGK